MKKFLIIISTIISFKSFGQVGKIKIQKEKTDTYPNINCPFIFTVDSTILNKKLSVGTVMFSGRGYTKEHQKKYDANRPFTKQDKYLISYKSFQNELSDWCNDSTIKIIKVKVEASNDTIFSVLATFGPR